VPTAKRRCSSNEQALSFRRSPPQDDPLHRARRHLRHLCAAGPHGGHQLLQAQHLCQDRHVRPPERGELCRLGELHQGPDVRQLPVFEVRGLQLIYHHRLDRADFALHVDGRVVHRACGQQILPHGLLSLRLFDGRAVPDGDVHTVEDGRYPQAQYPLDHPHHLPRLWRGACDFHVRRLCQIHPA